MKDPTRPTRQPSDRNESSELIQKIMDTIPKNLAAVVDPVSRSELLANHMVAIDKSTSSETKKQEKIKKLLLEYIMTRPKGISIDPSEIEKYMTQIANMTELVICARGTRPDECVSDLDDVLKFLGTTRADMVKQHGRSLLDILRKELVLGRDCEIRGKKSNGEDNYIISHYGMRKLARRLTTPQANIMFECMGACYDVVKESTAQLHSFRDDRTINLGEHKLITECLNKFTFQSEGGGNLLLNIEKKLLKILFGMGKASLVTVCGIDGEIRDASAKQLFITFSTAVRDRLRKRLHNAARDSPGGVISVEDERQIFKETVEFMEYYIRDWRDVEERIRDFLVCILLDHRDEVELRSGRKVSKPLQVSSRQVRARLAGP